MAKKTSGLGRGLGALLGDEVFSSENKGIISLPISNIERNETQPRKDFDEEKLVQLADSIRHHGILQPLIVRKLQSGYYQIVAGERRWRAARIAELEEVPAVVVEADDRMAAELAMIENLQREDLNPMEEAVGFQALIEQYHLTQGEAAECVGKSRSAVANTMRLLNLTPEVQNNVRNNELSAGHARALIPLPAAFQIQGANTIIQEGLSVRQAEILAKRLAAQAEAEKLAAIAEAQAEIKEKLGLEIENEIKVEKPPSLVQIDYAAEAQKKLASKLGRGVKIVTGRRKGRIVLEYYGLDDLNDLLEALELLQFKKSEG